MCECGCGRTTSIAKHTHKRDGHVRGQHVRFVMGHGMRGRTRVPGNLKHGLSYTPRYQKNKTLRAKYGITLTDYEQMSEEQGHRCAICSEEKKLYVDHDHETGHVRGLLCNRCNIRLAALDDPEWMSRAVTYKTDATTSSAPVSAG